MGEKAQSQISRIDPTRITPVRSGILQRACACGNRAMGGECAECAKKKGLLQRKTQHSALGTHEQEAVPSIVHDVLRSPGQPLDPTMRAFFEPRLGCDFSQVRLHTDVKAAESAQAVNALAYTVGRDVVFGAGQYLPGTGEGKRLLAHELVHVTQQRGLSGLQRFTMQIGPPHDVFERQADEVVGTTAQTGIMKPIARLSRRILQRDLARPPRGAPVPRRELTPEEIEAAITFNQDRFSDPYSVRVIRDLLGLEPVPPVVDEAFVHAVVEWQAARRMTQDGMVGHRTTRAFYLELVAEGQFRDAILLVMDSYRLPGDLRLHNVRVGVGPNCCGAGGGADAVTSGGPHCGGGPIDVCFCRALIPRTPADYDHFVRITGHELIHVPQCAAGTGNVDVDEFEAFFWEACARGRAPRLGAADRVGHAHTALGHFAAIPVALRTPARIAMRNQLNTLIAAGGVGPC